jgi:uncharacterized protein HemX
MCNSGLSVLLVLLAPATPAEVYRWVDAQGQVHYEDRSQSQSANDTRSYAPPVSAAENPQQRMEKTQKLLNAYQAERQQAREEREKHQKELEKRQRKCSVARDKLRQYQSYGGIYRLDKDGNRVYLGEQERNDLMQKTRDDIAKWCG